MQSQAVKQVLSSLERYFPQSTFVDRKEDGIDEAIRYAYIRKETDGANNYEIEEEWLVGRYVAVAESEEDNVLQKLWSLIESSEASAEVVLAGDVSEDIYMAETGQQLTRNCNIVTVTFLLRTFADCPTC